MKGSTLDEGNEEEEGTLRLKRGAEGGMGGGSETEDVDDSAAAVADVDADDAAGAEDVVRAASLTVLTRGAVVLGVIALGSLKFGFFTDFFFPSCNAGRACE